MTRPLIGITLDFQTKDTYSPYPWYALRTHYSSAIMQHGGLPVHLCHEMGAVEDYISRVDGLLFTGGDFDIDPQFYGQEKKHERVIPCETRTNFEMALMKAALNQQKPILGICAGEQLMNVILGGTLIQHIPDTIENCLEHEDPPHNTVSHSVAIKKDTLLHKIVQKEELMVNTSHHQAVGTVGKDVIINAVAPDGVIEGIEYTGHPFCLGVEWHPEYLLTDGDHAVMQSLVDAAQRVKPTIAQAG